MDEDLVDFMFERQRKTETKSMAFQRVGFVLAINSNHESLRAARTTLSSSMGSRDYNILTMNSTDIIQQ